MQAQTQTTDAGGGHITAVLRHFVTQQKADVELPSHWTVDHATREIARALGLPERNAENVPQVYGLFAKNPEGRSVHLPPSATLRDTVQDGSEIEPLPEVVPGGAAPKREGR